MKAARVIRLVCALDLLLVVLAGIVGLAAGRTVQLIDPYDAVQREITGKPGRPVGEPVSVFVLGQSRLLPQPEGEAHPYYDRSKGYPLQMRTFWLVYALVAATVLVGTLVVLALTRSAARRAASASQPP